MVILEQITILFYSLDWGWIYIQWKMPILSVQLGEFGPMCPCVTTTIIKILPWSRCFLEPLGVHSHPQLQPFLELYANDIRQYEHSYLAFSAHPFLSKFLVPVKILNSFSWYGYARIFICWWLLGLFLVWGCYWIKLSWTFMCKFQCAHFYVSWINT